MADQLDERLWGHACRLLLPMAHQLDDNFFDRVRGPFMEAVSAAIDARTPVERWFATDEEFQEFMDLDPHPPQDWTAENENDFAQKWDNSEIEARIASVTDSRRPNLLEVWKRCASRMGIIPIDIIGRVCNLKYPSLLRTHFTGSAGSTPDPVWSEEYAQLFHSILIHPKVEGDAGTIAMLLACTAMCRRNERKSYHIGPGIADSFLLSISEHLQNNVRRRSIQEIYNQVLIDSPSRRSSWIPIFTEIVNSLPDPHLVPATDLDETRDISIEVEDLELLLRALRKGTSSSKSGVAIATGVLVELVYKHGLDPLTPEDCPVHAASLRSALRTLYKGTFRNYYAEGL